MTIEELKARTESIRRVYEEEGNSESAHGAEDALVRDFLLAVSAGRTEGTDQMAKILYKFITEPRTRLVRLGGST